MSIDEYNHHARLGPMAGPPTNASQLAGQQAYDNANRQIPQGTAYAAPSRPPGQIPKFLRVGALKRGLWLIAIAMVVAPISSMFLRPNSNMADFVGAVTILAFLLGVFLVFCGLVSKIAGMRNKKAVTPTSEASATPQEHVEKP